MLSPSSCHLLAPFQGAEFVSVSSGGLRYAPTTGYYLTALRAETNTLCAIETKDVGRSRFWVDAEALACPVSATRAYLGTPPLCCRGGNFIVEPYCPGSL
jgi:hypothetical protein